MATLWSFTAIPILEGKGWREANQEEILSVCPYFFDDFCGDPFMFDPVNRSVHALLEAWQIQENREKSLPST